MNRILLMLSLVAEPGEECQVEVIRGARCAPAIVGDAADEAELPAATGEVLLHGRARGEECDHFTRAE